MTAPRPADDATDPRLPAGFGSDRANGSPIRLAIGAVVVGIVASQFGWTATILVIAALLAMIALHELGHYLAARWGGMKVTEFFLGFGPRLWSVRRGETEYGLKAIPLGAYVKIPGMYRFEEVDPADEERTYRQQSFPKRMLVAVAGSAMHFVIATVLLFVLFVGFGVRDLAVFDVGEVLAGSPAAGAGLEPGDEIVAIDGQPVVDWEQLRTELGDRPGDSITLTVVRAGERVVLPVRLHAENPEGEPTGFLGVRADFPRQTVAPLAAVGETAKGLGETAKLSVEAMASFFNPGHLFGDYLDQVLGRAPVGADGNVEGNDERVLSPVGAVQLASDAARTGLPELLGLLVAINVFIGLINLFPLLPFDGGHVVIAAYERIREGRRPRERYLSDVLKMFPVSYAVMAVFVFVGLSALWLDLTDPVQLFD